MCNFTKHSTSVLLPDEKCPNSSYGGRGIWEEFSMARCGLGLFFKQKS